MSAKTVLIIEDSPDLADSLYDIIEIEGHVPVIALSGREGVAKAHEIHPDLILLDIRLPDIDGYQVYQKIRSDETWGYQATVLVLTASEAIENISKNIDLPVSSILFKPDMSISALTDKIRQHLSTDEKKVVAVR